MILSGYSSRIFEMRSVPRASATSEGVSELEPLKTITALSLLPHHVQHAVHQLCTLCVVALGPVVASPLCPNTKLSGLKIWPKGPDLTLSMVPGSRSTRTALGTYLPPLASL